MLQHCVSLERLCGAVGIELRILLHFDVFKAPQLPSLARSLLSCWLLLQQQEQHDGDSLLFAGASSNLILSLIIKMLYSCSSCVLIKSLIVSNILSKILTYFSCWSLPGHREEVEEEEFIYLQSCSSIENAASCNRCLTPVKALLASCPGTLCL